MSQAILPTDMTPGDRITIVYKSETPDEQGYFVRIRKDEQLETFESVVISDDKALVRTINDHDHSHFREIPLIDIYEVKKEASPLSVYD